MQNMALLHFTQGFYLGAPTLLIWHARAVVCERSLIVFSVWKLRVPC